MEKIDIELNINLSNKEKILKSYKSILDLDDINDFLSFLKKMKKFYQNEIRNKNFQSNFLENKSGKNKSKTQCGPDDKEVAPSFTEVQVIPHQKYIKINWILDRGCDGNGSPYPIEKLVYLYRPKEGDETEDVVMSVGGSNSDGTGSLETATDQLIPNTVYKKWYLSTIFPTYDEEKPITHTIEHFRTIPTLLKIPRFTRIDRFSRGKNVIINYQINLGQDTHDEPFSFTATKSVVVLDGDGNEIAENNSGELNGTFKINDLKPDDYSGWKLETETTFIKGTKKTITGDIADFSIQEIKAPSFTTKVPNPKQNLVIVDYELDMGINEQGKPYNLEGTVNIYDQDDIIRGVSDDGAKGSVTGYGLDEGTEYKGWYLTAETQKRGDETIKGQLNKFTTSYNPEYPEFIGYNIDPFHTEVNIFYSIEIGHDKNNEKFSLLSKVYLIDRKGNKIGSSGGMNITGNIVVEDLVSGQTYSGWKLVAQTSSKLNPIIIKRIQEFKTTPYEIEEPEIVKVVSDPTFFDVEIIYQINLGNDQNNEPYTLTENVVIEDNSGNTIATSDNKDPVSIILIEKLEPGTRYNWKLIAQTSSTISPILTYDFSFKTLESQLTAPEFSEQVHAIPSATDVKISYQINLGYNPSGESYKLVGPVVLYDEDRVSLGQNESQSGIINVNNLKPNTTYSGWFLEAYTDYSSTTPVKGGEVDTFTTLAAGSEKKQKEFDNKELNFILLSSHK